MPFSLNDALAGVDARPLRQPPFPKLILASASPRRRQLLERLGLHFEVMPSHADELHLYDLSAGELCLANARHKTRWVARRYPRALVLGADTLVYTLPPATRNKPLLPSDHPPYELFGKPADMQKAAAMLRKLAGRSHYVVTAVCLMVQSHPWTKCFQETTEVEFHPLSDDDIQRYLDLVSPLDKAGAYGIQDRGDMIVRRIRGSLSNVIGLPLERLIPELAAAARQWHLGADQGS